MRKLLLLFSLFALSLQGLAQPFTIPQLIQRGYRGNFKDTKLMREILLALDTASANLPDSIDAEVLTATNTFFRGGTGDMDGDGNIFVSDVIAFEAILQGIEAGTPPTIEELFVGDVDGDGLLTRFDLWLIEDVLLGFNINNQNYIDAKANNRFLGPSLFGLSEDFTLSSEDEIPYFSRDLGISGSLMINGPLPPVTSVEFGYAGQDRFSVIDGFPGFPSGFFIDFDTLTVDGTIYSTEGNSFQWDSAYQIIKAGVGGGDLQSILDQGSVAEITAPFSVKTTENIDWSLDAVNREFNIWANDNQDLIFRTFSSPIGTHVEMYGGTNLLYFFIDNVNQRAQFNQWLYVQEDLTVTQDADLQGTATTGAHINQGINAQDQIRPVALTAGSPSFSVQTGDHIVLVGCADDVFTPVANLPTGATPGQIIRLKKTDQNADDITVQSSGGQTIDNNFAAVTVAQTLGAIELLFDGSNWWILNNYP